MAGIANHVATTGRELNLPIDIVNTQILNADRMARWWGIKPQGQIAGAREGLSAAVWRFDSQKPFEISAEPDPNTHIVSPILVGGVDCELFLDGKGRYRSAIKPGMVNLVRAGERPRAVEYQANCTFLHIYLPDAILQRCSDDIPGAPRVELRPIEAIADRTVHRIAEQIYAEILRGEAVGRLIVDGLTLQLARHLIRRWSNDVSLSKGRGGLAPWQLKRACEAMEARLDGDIGLSELAAIAGCSPTHFSRAFKQSTGKPPSRWLLDRRIERGCELILDKRLSLAEIALAVGFAAQPQFTTAFGRATGMTPGRYRRERMS